MTFCPSDVTSSARLVIQREELGGGRSLHQQGPGPDCWGRPHVASGLYTCAAFLSCQVVFRLCFDLCFSSFCFF